MTGAREGGERTVASPRLLAGVDGCRGGWVVVLWRGLAEGPVRAMRAASFAEVLDVAAEAVIVAVDMPIGLPERGSLGGRACDVAARAGLGERQSALFAVPSRAAVMGESYAEACRIARTTSDPPRAVSKQCFNLFAKIREIDRLMTPALQARVRECHPEVAFAAMAGGPLALPKKVKSQPHAPGLALRARLLSASGFPIGRLMAETERLAGSGDDDLIDAAACAWSAERIAAGRARSFPDDPPRDGRGLLMAIEA